MNRNRPATMLTKREHAALAIYLADPDVDAIAAVELADELFDVLDTPTELRDEVELRAAWDKSLLSLRRERKRFVYEGTP